MDLSKLPEQGTVLLVVVTALITGTITALMGVFGRTLAENLLKLLLAPFMALGRAVYAWVAPRNPFSLSMWVYRNHILRSELAYMESPIGFLLRVPLEHAFAPLKLTVGSKDEEKIDLFDYLSATRKFIVLGGPGSGKSTLMKSLIVSIVRRCCHPELNDLIPVFITLRDLATAQQTVQQAIVSAFTQYHFPGADGFVQSTLDAGRMIIVLDGLDEVGANRDFVASQILAFCKHDSSRVTPNRLIVTCREHSYRTRDLDNEIPAILRVEPFANHHIRIFLEGWPVYRGRTAIDLFSLIQKDPQIRDICRNPLLLTILTGLFLDTENFALPTSRERFYYNAVDELLRQRPGRRQITQTFGADEKRRILEGVTLERLETVAKGDDPEEITQDAIGKKALEVLGSDKVDIRELVKELVEINGIIKPMKEESFTCAHRTILEYFAACESHRSRTTAQVLAVFSARQELIEVLFFYCALTRNQPALRDIVRYLIDNDRILDAARSLLFMSESPGADVIKIIAEQLFDNLLVGTDEAMITATLGALSSLAVQRHADFERARQLFGEAIERLTAGEGSGASALQTAIAASPEIAMTVIPGLLKHRSERWRLTGVQLLRDVGTDDALDQLVRLLTDADPFIRLNTGILLAEMILTRNGELRDRAAILPARTDWKIWPLERYFPGRVAIPIAEAVAPQGPTTACQAINRAIDFINSNRPGSLQTRRANRMWHRVNIDRVMSRLRVRVGAYSESFALLIPVAVTLIVFYALSFSLVTGRSVVFSTTWPYLATTARGLAEIRAAAGAAVSYLEETYPQPALGWRRVFPWNWNLNPILPNGQAEYNKLVNVRSGLFDPLEFASSRYPLSDLERSLSPELSVELRKAVDAFLQDIRPGRGVYAIVGSGQSAPQLVLLLTTGPMIFAGIYGIRMTKRRNRYSVEWMHWLTLFNELMIVTFIVVFGQVFHIGPVGMYYGLAGIACFILAVGWTLQRISWPRNRYLVLIDEVRGAPLAVTL
jgi:hypothetical protein